MKFLQTRNYYEEVRSLFDNNEHLDVAVAFLGHDCLSLFKMNPNKSIRVICNFESGACNPSLVEEIINYPNVELKTNNRLHAKVLLQNNSVIMGSANLSANGLSLEGAELTAWKEAGVFIENSNVIDETRSWFDELWSESGLIYSSDIDKQKENWKKRRAVRPINQISKSLVDAALDDSEQLKDREIYFAIYRQTASNEANSAYDRVKSEHEQFSETISFYEGWSDLPDNAYLISIYLGPRGGVEVEGVYQTPSEPILKSFRTNDGEESDIKICFKKNEALGLKLTGKDKVFIKENIEHLLQHEQFEADDAFLVPLSDWVSSVKDGI